MVSSESGNCQRDEDNSKMTDRWLEEFLMSEEYHTLLSVQQKFARDIVLFFKNLMQSGFSASPQQWNQENISECALFLIPETVALRSLPPAAIAPVLTTFFCFLERKNYLATASLLIPVINSLDAEIIRRSRFPLYWILKRKFKNDLTAQAEPDLPLSTLSDQVAYERYLYQCLHLVVETWGSTFIQSGQYKALDSASQDQYEYIISSITDACLIYYQKGPKDWDVETIRNCLLDLYPSDAIESPDFFTALVPVLYAFFRFLEQEKLHTDAGEMADLVESIADEVVKRSGDPQFWSQEKLASVTSIMEWSDPKMEGKVQAYLEAQKEKQKISSSPDALDGEKKKGARKHLPPRGKKKRAKR